MLTVISLGAGVQSSTMALMASKGLITPMPDAAIFADTQSEPRAVYAWLNWLEPQLPFPVRRVTAGNLMLDQLTSRKSADGQVDYIRNFIPAFIENDDGTQGMLKRTCTREYKVAPIRREVRQLMEARGLKTAEQWVGISLDEAHRMRPTGVQYVTNRWPLIEKNMTRGACLVWMERHGYPRPPKSACIMCPYHDDAQWADLPLEERARAASFESQWNVLARGDQRSTQVRGVIRLHRSMRPLGEVEFKPKQKPETLDLFGDECEGMCGT